MRRSRHTGYFLIVAVLFVLVQGCPASSERERGESGDEEGGEEESGAVEGRGGVDFADVVEAVRPSVVNIYTRQTRGDEGEGEANGLPRQRVAESLGSGFVFDEAGLVMTNDHVVAGAEGISVRFFDERVFEAEVVGRDAETDLAVLRLLDVEGGLPAVRLGDSDRLRVGNWVLVIGNPLGLTSTVTAGIVSATGRQVLPGGKRGLRFQDFIQTDASINPGNSGGPVINYEGEVVGVATALSASGEGLGFAIPVNMVKRVVEDLVEEGEVRRSWLGVYVGNVPRALREELGLEKGGILITRVVEGGPAAEAGLRAGDILLRIEEERINEPSRLGWVASTMGIGREVEVEIVRGEEWLMERLVMGAMPVE